jgi:pimeloyl-ACP methyl ester carboxylesterase
MMANGGDVTRIPESMLGLAQLLGRVPTPAEALRLFATPVRVEMARKEAEIAATAEQFTFNSDGREIAAWKWGQGPQILLLHGWNGRAMNLSAFVEPLLAKGYSVLAFDAPGHGESEGDMCYAPLFADAARKLARLRGDFYGIISHSFGTCAATVAQADGLKAKKVVYLSTMCWIKMRFYEFAAAVGLDTRGQNAMWALSESYFGPGRIESYHGDHAAIKFQSEGLIIHCEDDKEVLPAQSQAIAQAWQNCDLWLTKGLGHFRILRSKPVIERVTEFMSHVRD